jgi:hypothetical protein
MKNVITRRDFMRNTAYAVLGTAAGLSSLQTPAQEKKSRIVLIRHADALDENFKFNEKIIQQMFDEAVMALFELDDPVKVFKKLLKPDDIVGIKSNVWNYLPTPAELEKAIKCRVLDAGVEEKNISIDDRGVRENPVFQKATAIINVRPLRTHYLSGISGCMKNYIPFGKNWPDYHPNNCESLAALFSLPMVKGKNRLNVLCTLTPQFHGRGPHHFNRRYVWPYKGIIVGADPVAVDALGLEIIMAKRREYFGPKNSLPTVPRHIKAADVKYGLGNSDFNKIEVIKLGWKQGILI